MHYKKGFLGILGFGLAMTATSAFADGDFYLGAGGGGTNFESSTLSVDLGTGDPVDDTYDDSDGNFRFYGGYRLNQNFAVEAMYSALGEFEIIDGDNDFVSTYEADSVDLAAVGLLPLWDGRIDLFARAGIAFWSGDAELTSDTGSPSYLQTPATSGEDLFWSVGVNLNLLESKRLTFRSELTSYEISDFEKLETLGFNFQYRF